MDIRGVVVSNLKSLSINYDLLRPNLQEQLIEIEEYISKCTSIRLESLNNLKKYSINIKKISDNTSVCKATIYNNPDTLKLYIENRISNIKFDEKENSSIISSDKYNDLKTKYTETHKLLDKATIDLINMYNLKREIHEVEEDNKQLSLKLSLLSNENNALTEELSKLRDLLSSLNNDNVINFKGTKKSSN